MERTNYTPGELVAVPVQFVPHEVHELPGPGADGIAIGTINGHLSIYLSHAGSIRVIHLGPQALDVVAGLLAQAVQELNRQECPSLGTVQ